MTDVFRPLLGRVKVENGTTVVHRGEELPADIADGEADRLDALDAVGEPFKRDDELAVEQMQQDRADLEADVEAEGRAPGALPDAPDPEAEEIVAEDFETFVADATADEVVAASQAANDPDYTQALVDAEVSVRGGNARKKVLALDES